MARRLDDLAYGAGSWWGAVRARLIRVLVPRLSGLPRRSLELAGDQRSEGGSRSTTPERATRLIRRSSVHVGEPRPRSAAGRRHPAPRQHLERPSHSMATGKWAVRYGMGAKRLQRHSPERRATLLTATAAG